MSELCAALPGPPLKMIKIMIKVTVTYGAQKWDCCDITQSECVRTWWWCASEHHPWPYLQLEDDSDHHHGGGHEAVTPPQQHPPPGTLNQQPLGTNRLSQFLTAQGLIRISYGRTLSDMTHAEDGGGNVTQSLTQSDVSDFIRWYSCSQ